MSFDKYYEARDIIEDIIEKDLLGPVEEDEIIPGDRPNDYYILGKLYPQNTDAARGNSESSSDDCGNLDGEDSITLCNNKKPSSFGISFCLKSSGSSFVVKVKSAKYDLVSREEARKKIRIESDSIKEFWKREIIGPEKFIIEAEDLKIGNPITENIDDNLVLNIMLHRIMRNGDRIITVSLINKYINDTVYDKPEKMYFQPEIEIAESQIDSFGDVVHKKELNAERDVIELNMLYQKIRNYASGHGCAVRWEHKDDLLIIKSAFLPRFEVLQMKPSLAFSGDVLSMKYLSTASKSDVINGLSLLVTTYKEWINKQKSEINRDGFLYPEIAKENLIKCNETAERIKKSIDTLKDDVVFKAFSLANKAMFMQRKQTLINNESFESDDTIKWYPFQLAFFVQEINSFVNPSGVDRKLVDLLWFPTGGGKTEAYLGIAAFCIFLRRLRRGGDGVTVIMRYTMRLLTFQQFERASALICACEIIRKEQNIPGGEIGIGLWAGQALTPNKLDVAKRIVEGHLEANDETGNPVQLRKCPWCGASIDKKDYSCDMTVKRMYVKCPGKEGRKCIFKNGLPVHLIDEDIYVNKPTYIVATIDKFAQIALNEDCAALFGKKVGKKPPELIIQDELHLISGPLGTITGLYEAAIKKLCEFNGVEAKVIASTATIRNAKEQINALYASDYAQFPPQAIDLNNSFFAEISDRNEKPGRLYLGCMAIGTSPTTMMIRAMAALLYGSRYLYELDKFDDSTIDAYWTITGYFNTLRELGGAIVRVVDDIQDRFRFLRESKFSTIYPMKRCEYRYDHYKELTSREKSEDIGKVIQEELTKPFKRDGSTYPYDFVLASNMISVGVDVGRLGSMVVVGQPFSTAEYIQATSRVGRSTPGIVLTTYNQSKSRDRSHYEQFSQYHSSFYKYVEATSITPFADRARDRALQTLYVILCRYYVPRLFRDKDAVNYSKDLPELRQIREYIFNYVEQVDPDELDNVKEEIEQIEEEWETKASRRDVLHYRYSRYISKDKALFEPDYEENSRFRVLNSMRSVETTVEVKVRE